MECYTQALRSLGSPFADEGAAIDPGSLDPALCREAIEVLNAASRSTLRGSDGRTLYARLVEGLRQLDRALAFADRLRLSYPTDAARLSAQEATQDLLEEAASAAMRLHRLTDDPAFLDAAFGYADRGRGSLLFERSREAGALERAGVPDSLRVEVDRLRGRLAELDVRLRKEAEKTAVETRLIETLRKTRFITAQDLDDVRSRIEQTYGVSHRQIAPEASLRTVRLALDSATAVVEYFVGKKSLFAFVVREKETRAWVWKLPAGFDESVRAFLASMKTLDKEQYVRNAQGVYDLLVRPIQPAIAGAGRVVIVPDGELAKIPFEALLAGPAVGSDASGWPYLLKSYQVSYAPSARQFAVLRSTADIARQVPRSFVGFAPVFSDTLPGGEAIAARGSLADEDGDLRSIVLDGRQFATLKHSEEEVRSIAASFRRHGAAADERVRLEATEERFRNDAGRYAVVHIATHGCADVQAPDLSLLLFAGREGVDRNDGALHAAEAACLFMKAELVVLSSCDGGVGKVAAGEGVLALARSFSATGARNVMSALWKVRDASTMDLMVGFYDSYLNGKPLPAALREAKLRLISRAATAFPYHWAGFIVQGE
jgi:CHAT domain-containing protein